MPYDYPTIDDLSEEEEYKEIDEEFEKQLHEEELKKRNKELEEEAVEEFRQRLVDEFGDIFDVCPNCKIPYRGTTMIGKSGCDSCKKCHFCPLEIVNQEIDISKFDNESLY